MSLHCPRVLPQNLVALALLASEINAFIRTSVQTNTIEPYRLRTDKGLYLVLSIQY